ncbi:MAG: hypothetical protein FWE69_02815 [Clostridiales bacterium]|nr:hypothetical protein [Clostridiales bacterium]
MTFFQKHKLLLCLAVLLCLTGCVCERGKGTNENPGVIHEQVKPIMHDWIIPEPVPTWTDPEEPKLSEEEINALIALLLPQLQGEGCFVDDDDAVLEVFAEAGEESGTTYTTSFRNGVPLWSRHRVEKTGKKEIEYWYKGQHYTSDGQKWSATRRDFSSLPHHDYKTVLSDLVELFSGKYRISLKRYEMNRGFEISLYFPWEEYEGQETGLTICARLDRVDFCIDDESVLYWICIMAPNFEIYALALGPESELSYMHRESAYNLINDDMGEASPLWRSQA